MFKPLDTLLPVLETTPARWQALCQTLPPDLLSRKPADGEWSALECLNHLLDTEKNIFPVRVRAFLAGVNFPAFNPDEEGAAVANPTPSALAAEFASLRAASLDLLKTLQASRPCAHSPAPRTWGSDAGAAAAGMGRP